MEVKYRKTVKVEKKEISAWRSHFSLYGTKKEFVRETGIFTPTLSRILENGKGEERVVKIIRDFLNPLAIK